MLGLGEALDGSSPQQGSGGAGKASSANKRARLVRALGTVGEREVGKYPTNQFDKSISVDDIRERVHQVSN